MFEPQGAGFFLLLMVVFGGLLVWVALARQLVFRVFAACLAFLPAMVFGVAAVNKFYDYYQTWGGMINDLTSQGAGNLPKYAAGGTGTNKQFDKNIGRVTSQAEDAQVGYLFQTSVTGAHSHLTRDVLRLPAAAVLPEALPALQVPGHRAAARLTGWPAGLGRRHGRDPHLPQPAGNPPRRRRGAGDARHRWLRPGTGSSASTTRAASRT